MLTVLTAKAIRRLARGDIIPRALVDDVSAQWVGSSLQHLSGFWSALKGSVEDATDVGSIIQA
eukprot:38358-Pyramimonas_sp.AAC.1